MNKSYEKQCHCYWKLQKNEVLICKRCDNLLYCKCWMYNSTVICKDCREVSRYITSVNHNNLPPSLRTVYFSNRVTPHDSKIRFTNFPYYLNYVSFAGGGCRYLNILCNGYSKNYKVLWDEFYSKHPTPLPAFLNNYNYTVLSMTVYETICFPLILYVSHCCKTVDISYYLTEDDNDEDDDNEDAGNSQPLSLILLFDYLPAAVTALVGVLILIENHIRAPMLLQISDNLPTRLQILYNSYPCSLKPVDNHCDVYYNMTHVRPHTNKCLTLINRRNLPIMYDKYVRPKIAQWLPPL